MNENKDLATLDDIHLLVNDFYGTVREDELLSPIFNGVVGNRWSEHMEKMYRFWQTVLLNEHTYYNSPFPPHAKLPIQKSHFERWLHLWNAAVDRHFSGDKANEAKWRGEKMATIFLSKIEYLGANKMTHLL